MNVMVSYFFTFKCLMSYHEFHDVTRIVCVTLPIVLLAHVTQFEIVEY